MGCQNCPLGHQALEYITHAYADKFIPIAYHTYTGDVLESGMTDYVQYFLGLNAAPTAVVNRAISGVSPMVASMVNGNNDYQYSVGDGSTWLDAVSQQLATDTEADIATTATYDESTGNITINYEVTYAITKPTNPAALLCVITEDGLTGYQTNAFSTQTDPDLGEWGKGGIYGKQNVYPFTFNDVARALYPTNAYNGQTGLLPASVDHEQSYQGTITLNVKTDAPYVKDINNLHATCIIIDTETGTYVNASRAKVVNAPASINNHQNTNTTVQAVADGICIKAPQNTLITLTDALGRTLNQSMISGTQTIKTNHKGLIIVHTSNGHNKQSFKIVR
jgi:hypothetical protein